MRSAILSTGRPTCDEFGTKADRSELFATSDGPLRYDARLRVYHIRERENARRSDCGKGDKEDISEEHSEAGFGT